MRTASPGRTTSTVASASAGSPAPTASCGSDTVSCPSLRPVWVPSTTSSTANVAISRSASVDDHCRQSTAAARLSRGFSRTTGSASASPQRRRPPTERNVSPTFATTTRSRSLAHPREVRRRVERGTRGGRRRPPRPSRRASTRTQPVGAVEGDPTALGVDRDAVGVGVGERRPRPRARRPRPSRRIGTRTTALRLRLHDDQRVARGRHHGAVRIAGHRGRSSARRRRRPAHAHDLGSVVLAGARDVERPVGTERGDVRAVHVLAVDAARVRRDLARRGIPSGDLAVPGVARVHATPAVDRDAEHRAAARADLRTSPSSVTAYTSPPSPPAYTRPSIGFQATPSGWFRPSASSSNASSGITAGAASASAIASSRIASTVPSRRPASSSDGWMLSEVVDGSSSSPRRTHPHATRSCSSRSRSFVSRSFTNSTAMKQPVARTSPIASYRSASAREALEPGGLQRHHVLQHRLAPRRRRASRGRPRTPPGARTRSTRSRRRRSPSTPRCRAGADRHHAAAHRLAERHQVGLDAEPLDREHRARPAVPRLHLVGAQQEVELAAQVGERRPERLGRRDAPARPHHRLDHEPGDLARVDRVVQQVVAQVVHRAVARAAGSRDERRAVRVRYGTCTNPGISAR